MDENTYFNLHKLKFSILLNLFKKKYIYIYIYICQNGHLPLSPKRYAKCRFQCKTRFDEKRVIWKNSHGTQVP